MLSVICGVLLMSLDGAIANIALPTIARDLQVGDAATVWVVNAYNVGSALMTLIFSLSHGNATVVCLQVACGFALAGAIASVSRSAFRPRPSSRTTSSLRFGLSPMSLPSPGGGKAQGQWSCPGGEEYEAGTR